MRTRPACRTVAKAIPLLAAFGLSACKMEVGDAAGQRSTGSSSGSGAAGNPAATGTTGNPIGTGTTGNSTTGMGGSGNPTGGAGGSNGTGPGLALNFHRLNKAEYNNTVRDLLGTPLTPADDFAEDELGSKPGAS